MGRKDFGFAQQNNKPPGCWEYTYARLKPSHPGMVESFSAPDKWLNISRSVNFPW